MSVKTVADLIDALKKLPGDTPVIGAESSADGVKVIPQHSGSVLIASARLVFNKAA